MDNTKPELPRPSMGDELLLVLPKDRANEERTLTVTVVAMARFKVTLAGPDGERLPWYLEEMDIRTGESWDKGRGMGARLHTPETLAYKRRETAVNNYLYETRIHVHSLGSTLGKAALNDKIGFVNALRRFEGLEEF